MNQNLLVSTVALRYSSTIQYFVNANTFLLLQVQSSLKDLHKQILVGDAPSLDMFREVLRK